MNVGGQETEVDLKEIEREGEYDQDTLYKMLRELIKI